MKKYTMLKRQQRVGRLRSIFRKRHTSDGNDSSSSPSKTDPMSLTPSSPSRDDELNLIISKLPYSNVVQESDYLANQSWDEDLLSHDEDDDDLFLPRRARSESPRRPTWTGARPFVDDVPVSLTIVSMVPKICPREQEWDNESLSSLEVLAQHLTCSPELLEGSLSFDNGSTTLDGSTFLGRLMRGLCH